MVLHLETLRDKPRVLNHSVNRSKSICNNKQSSKEDTQDESLMSSAKHKIRLLDRTLDTLLINKEKRSGGDRCPPCGTPDVAR